MPNFCSNTLIVSGEEENLKRFVDENSVPFQILIPKNRIKKEFKKVITDMPRWRNRAVEFVECGIMKPSEYFIKTRLYIRNENGDLGNSSLPLSFRQSVPYLTVERDWDWCIENWGTKWDALDTIFLQANVNEVVYNFDTAWSPPVAWLEKVSKLYPDLKFELNYEERGCGFQGRAMAQNGEVDDFCEEYSDDTEKIVPYMNALDVTYVDEGYTVFEYHVFDENRDVSAFTNKDEAEIYLQTLLTPKS